MAVEGIFDSEPCKDWVTDTFIVWLELMVRPAGALSNNNTATDFALIMGPQEAVIDH